MPRSNQSSALYSQQGFETIVLRADSLGREAFFKALDLLYSAGFVILAATDALDADVRRELQHLHTERTVFDVASGTEKISDSELISRVLNYASSLRLGAHSENAE